jgi:hypothetical protein
MDIHFQNAIINGNIEDVKTEANSRFIDIGYNGFYYLKIACYYGHIDIAKWLIQQRSIRDKKIYLECIELAIENQQSDTAKYIYSLKKVKINDLFDRLCMD